MIVVLGVDIVLESHICMILVLLQAMLVFGYDIVLWDSAPNLLPTLL